MITYHWQKVSSTAFSMPFKYFTSNSALYKEQCNNAINAQSHFNPARAADTSAALLLERTAQACAVWTLWSINMSSENIRTADRIRNANSVWVCVCEHGIMCVLRVCMSAQSPGERASAELFQV